MAANNLQPVKYVYELPFKENRDLCRILDQNDKWEELAGEYMGYRMLDIEDFRRQRSQKSPTEQLLTSWGTKNHTVYELFVLLSKMQHHQALIVLKPFIDRKYHVLINEGEENISRILGSINDKPQHPAMPMSPVSHTVSVEENANCNFNIYTGRVLPQKHEEKILNITRPKQSEKEAATSPQEGGSQDKALANKQTASTQPQRSTPTRRDSECSSVFSEGMSSSIPQIAYKELLMATNNWDLRNVLGRGGFGIVFRGLWKNTQVAIKRIEQRGGSEAAGGSYQAQLEQSSKELKILNSIRHDFVLPLYGFSVGGEHPCLIYQLMPNGSLEDRLQCKQGSDPLTWIQRHKIALGTACGLQFLHTLGDKPLIHGDIKSANILLDANLQPRIGDFGLAREGPIAKYTHIKLTRVQGTKPYLPDDFLRSKQISTKVDTYSFGIVLFEIATGQRAFDANRTPKLLIDVVKNHKQQNQLIKLKDHRLQNDPYNMISGHIIFNDLVTLGQQCTVSIPKDRPEMEAVLTELKNLEERRQIVSRAHSVMHSPSPCPSNPLEHQMFYDALSQQRRTSLAMESPWNACGGESSMFPPQSMMGSHQIPRHRFPDSLRVDIPTHELMAGNFIPSPYRMVPSPQGVPLPSPSIAIEFASSSIAPSTQPTMNPFHTPSPTPNQFIPPYPYPVMPANLQPSPHMYPYQHPISPNPMGRQKSPLLEDQQGVNMVQTLRTEFQSNNNVGTASNASVLFLPITIPGNTQQDVNLEPSYSGSSFFPDLTELGISDKQNSTLDKPAPKNNSSSCSEDLHTGELPNFAELGISGNANSDSLASPNTCVQKHT